MYVPRGTPSEYVLALIHKATDGVFNSRSFTSLVIYYISLVNRFVSFVDPSTKLELNALRELLHYMSSRLRSPCVRQLSITLSLE